MADVFVRLVRAGNGYVFQGGGRTDAVMYIDHFDVDSDDQATGVPYEFYTAVIAGFSGNGVDVREMYMIEDISDGTWHIHSDAASGLGAAAFAKVLFISRTFCTDSGITTQA